MSAPYIQNTIELIDAAGRRMTAEIAGHHVYAPHSGPNCSLTLTSPALVVSGTGPDYFDAFCRIREALAAHQILPLCYGASKYVYPSGMCRDMGLGRRAYNRKLGEKPTSVDIFATGPDVEPVSVAEQRAYAEAAWEAARKR
ncbi:MAG: hypothetical protein ACLGH0_13145 [Thermoanaerobaculia bacterium]